MSYCTKNECTKREFEKNFRGSYKLPQAHEKVCDENERKYVLQTKKNVIDGRREFIGRLWKSSIIDCKEPQVDDC